MLEETFIFLPGVHERTEQRLWRSGIRTWDHLLDARAVPGVSANRLSFWKMRIREVRENGVDPRAIVRLLGSRYAWRAYKQLMAEPRFVDIETTEYRHQVTVVGVSDGDFYKGFVRGMNLEPRGLKEAFSGATCLVTFNGSSFDLPIIARVFPDVLPDVPHLDLRHLCRQLGYTGGLKRIEKELEIRRADGLREVDGAEAIMLWYRHTFGDERALQDLIDYNAADVLNLKPLLDFVVPRLWERTRAAAHEEL